MMSNHILNHKLNHVRNPVTTPPPPFTQRNATTEVRGATANASLAASEKFIGGNDRPTNGEMLRE